LLAEKWCYRPHRTRILGAVSSSVREELSRHFPLLPVALTPNGVDGHRFAPDLAIRRSLRAAEGLAASDVVVLFVGGDWYRKGLKLAIRALAEPSCRAQSIVLWVVGAGDQTRFRSLARTSGVADRVRFFGPQVDVERFYQSADILLLPSLYETFALVAFEAAACGLPVVATGVGGISELVGSGEAGIIVSPTAEAVGAAVGRLAADPTLRRRLGAVARQRAHPYTWDRSVESVLELYRQLLEARDVRQMNVAGSP